MKYRFGNFLHSKFGLISFISTPPLLTFASSNGLKLVILLVISNPSPTQFCVVSPLVRGENKNFSNFFVISFGMILILKSPPCPLFENEGTYL